MRWMVNLDEPAERSVAWAQAFFAGYDTSEIEWVRLEQSHGQDWREDEEAVRSWCLSPTRRRRVYRLSCRIAGPFPAAAVLRKPCQFIERDGSCPPTPVGCVPGPWCPGKRDGGLRRRMVGLMTLHTLDEGLIWGVARAAYRFLQQTKQIPGRSNTVAMDAFAASQLAAFRQAQRQELPGNTLFSGGEIHGPLSQHTTEVGHPSKRVAEPSAPHML